MGITARGAWESVKRHFREMGIDTQTTDFTVVGIGDMSGDVFGNGMLLSQHIRLVAAFDHRHVFIDPDPDAGDELRRAQAPVRAAALVVGRLQRDADLAGRRRLAAQREVDPALAGGARARSAIEAESLTPTELISAILKAPVDLLYNGGIGTYVKAADESHAEVGDRANDAMRVERRATCAARWSPRAAISASRSSAASSTRSTGGRINTDAIDNSAGVDTSDHEVNIKILLGLVIADGELTEKQRNTLLAADDRRGRGAGAARQLLPDPGALGRAAASRPRCSTPQQRFIQFLEKAGRLNRALEFLPADEEIAERRGAEDRALTAPERAVLLAYTKMWLYDELLASSLPDDAWIADRARALLPADAARGLRRRDAAPSAAARDHRHARRQQHGEPRRLDVRPPADGDDRREARAEIVRAYLLTREVFGLVPLWQSIEALDNKVPDLDPGGDADRGRPAHRRARPRGSCARGGSPSRWSRRSSTSRPASRRSTPT